MVGIELDKVNLNFRMRRSNRVSLKEFLLRQMYLRSVDPLTSVHALRDVSLRMNEGERIGIIGHNGAGKSTLLKLLAGIYPPTSGELRVRGKISSLFDIALGFEGEATGWENIRFRSYLHGETPRSIDKKIQSIADFSELGKFLTVPVRYYSAGMMVRLAFSIATAIEPEILLIDEVLGVGDLDFQRKARQRMRDMMAKARLIVVVSHDLDILTRLCDRAIWMDHGQVKLTGPIEQVTNAYISHVEGRDNPSTPQTPSSGAASGISSPSDEAIQRQLGRYAEPGDGSHKASWHFDDLPAGNYDIQATWPVEIGQATNAPYTIYDSGKFLATVRVNQTHQPHGATVDGVIYQSLGTFTIESGTVRVILSNRANNPVAARAVRVVPVAPSVPVIVDNWQPGYQEVGEGWITLLGWGGYGNTHSYAPAGDGSQSASWRVDRLKPGDYEVRITWTAWENRASNAPFQIYDGSSLLTVVRINQKVRPSGIDVHGISFQSLGVFSVRSGTLTVVLTDDADNLVVADAIHVVEKPAEEPVIIAYGQTGYREIGRWAA